MSSRFELPHPKKRQGHVGELAARNLVGVVPGYAGPGYTIYLEAGDSNGDILCIYIYMVISGSNRGWIREIYPIPLKL